MMSFFLNRFSFNEMMSGNNCRLPLPPNPPNPNPSAVLPCDARMDLAGHHWPTVHRSNFPLATSIDLASNALDVERTNQIDKMTYDMTYDNWHFEFSLSQKADLIQWCICLLFVSCTFEIKDQFSNFRYKKVGHQYFSLLSHRWHAKQEKSQIVQSEVWPTKCSTNSRNWCCFLLEPWNWSSNHIIHII